MMTMNEIEKRLYKALGEDLFKVYSDGYILENRYSKTGINIDDIESYWFDEYDYLLFPVFEQQHPFSDGSEFMYKEKRRLMFMSPVFIEDEESDIKKYKLNTMLYYTPFDKPNVIISKKVPRGIVEVNKTIILKIMLSNGRVIPVLMDGNSIKCEEDGLYLENDGMLTPTVEYFNRSSSVARVLKEFGIECVDKPSE